MLFEGSYVILTPEKCRERFGLPVDYSMIAPNYSITRSDLAILIGLWKASKNLDKISV